MKHPSKRIKSLAIALKEIEPYVRDGKHLRTGSPFKNFGDMRSREILANWLICAAFNGEVGSERLTFAGMQDPIGGDGVLVDTVTEETWPTEHVISLVPAGDTGEIEPRILAAVTQKLDKGGSAYAIGKTLVVLLEGGGERPWFPNRIAKALPQPLHFGAVWVVGLQAVEAGEYVYNVTQMDEEAGIAHVWRVRIAPDFDKWTVERIQ
jgi:hypothetical protein